MASVETLDAFERKSFFEYLEREEFRKWVWEQVLKQHVETAEAAGLERQLWRKRRALVDASRTMRLRTEDERISLLTVGGKIESLRVSGLLNEVRKARRKAVEEAVRVPRLHSKKKELEASRLVAQLVGKKKAELDKYRSRE